MESLFIFSLLLLASGSGQEVTTPSSRLPPRNFNHHPHDIKQYLKLKKPEPTKQGPVLFPNDSPPPPRLPLVVTTRPLLEAIANSDLNPDPTNNTVAEQSQIRGVAYKPTYLTRFDQYDSLAYTAVPLAIPDYEGASYPDAIPYADVLNKARRAGVPDNRYTDYEERTSLPPIYKALSDYARSKVLNAKQKPRYDYKVDQTAYERNYENNEISDGHDNSENNKDDNYAFSYSVRDRETGDDFSHSQQSSGSATNGEYRVRLPDGRMQIVSYTADENGYKADVRYDNEDNDKQIETEPNENQYKNNNYQYIDSQNQYNNYVQNFNANTNPINTNYNSRVNIDNADYTQRDFNVKQARDDYVNPYEASREYYNDYSSEYSNNYETHRSKYNAFKVSTTPTPIYSTVRPYSQETNYFTTRKPIDDNARYINDRIVEINAPSTTSYDGVTENVVVIAPKLYTNVRSSTPLVETVNTTPRPILVTPASYLASTIASIKERIKASKPILGNDFFQRINRYLSFN